MLGRLHGDMDKGKEHISRFLTCMASNVLQARLTLDSGLFPKKNIAESCFSSLIGHYFCCRCSKYGQQYYLATNERRNYPMVETLNACKYHHGGHVVLGASVLCLGLFAIHIHKCISGWGPRETKAAKEIPTRSEAD
jgi:hypothetical protein